MKDEDLTTAKVDGQLLHGRGTFDITAIDDVEIVIKHDEPRAQGAHPRHPRSGVRHRQAG